MTARSTDARPRWMPQASRWLLALAIAGSALAVGTVHTITLCSVTGVLAVAAVLGWWAGSQERPAAEPQTPTRVIRLLPKVATTSSSPPSASTYLRSVDSFRSSRRSKRDSSAWVISVSSARSF